MIKKGIKNLIKIIVISLLFITILSIINTSEVCAGSRLLENITSEGEDVAYIYYLNNYDNLYCIEYGYRFKETSYYLRYDYGNIDTKELENVEDYRKVMFLVANRLEKNYGNDKDDNISNAVWLIFDEQYQADSQDMLTKAEILKEFATVGAQIKKEGNIEIIKEPETLTLKEGENLGPFIISYPQYKYSGKATELAEDAFASLKDNGENALGTITIKLNGNIVEKDISALKEFYFTEEDGLIYGEENKVEFIYNANYYSGDYAIYMPFRPVQMTVICPICGYGTTVTYGGDTNSYDVLLNGGAKQIINGKEELVLFDVNSATVKNSNEGFKLNTNMYNKSKWNVIFVHLPSCIYADTSVYSSNYWTYSYSANPYYVKDTAFYSSENATMTYAERNKIIGEIKEKTDEEQWDYYIENYCDWQKTIYVEPNLQEIEDVIERTYYPEEEEIILNILKTDTANEPIANKVFNIYITGGTTNVSSVITNAEGQAQISITPVNTSTDIVLTLTEISDNYYTDIEPIKITFTYRDGIWQTTEDSSFASITREESEINLSIINTPKIEKIKIIKLNKHNSEVLEGVTFRIDLVNMQTSTGRKSIVATTNSNGEIILEDLIVIDPKEEININLYEIAVPDNGVDYLGAYATDSIKISFGYLENNSFITTNILTSGEYNTVDNSVIIKVHNVLTMDIKGNVWLDGQTGIKPVQSPNGKKDVSEKGIEGVVVNLRRSDGILVYTTTTDENGDYAFENVPASAKKNLQYYVEFVYDGISYIATQSGIDSNATEVDREEFNSKFITIEKDTAIGQDGTKTELQYEYNNDSAILITTENGEIKSEFIMTATTMPILYSTTVQNVNFGLVNKNVDLAAVTEIYSAKVTINGLETIYGYNNIKTLQEDENGNPDLSSIKGDDVSYNLYLYNSDYNYKISDYKLSSAHNENLNVNIYNAADKLLEKRQKDEELNVEVTYQILLNNQSATEATINQIAYYYDVNYILEGATPELVTLNGETYNKVILHVNKEFTNTNNQNIIELTFNVAKDSLGKINLGEAKNWVEIISYSTEGGLIDVDSAPDNILINLEEDDTDSTTQLNIQLNNIERQVSGYVFEDKKTSNAGTYNTGNGKYDSGEEKINDIIVQLIEIKDVTIGEETLRLEYIWQETVTGSNEVKFVTSDGLTESTYTVTNDEGQYTFNKNIVPGNYIVRFIYGDGTYYDETTSKNLTKYNGQDYKSTIDKNYNLDILDNSLYEDNSSMARDNEARRLEQMSYATSITVNNADKLIIDSAEKLNNTYMFADTSIIPMSISKSSVMGDSDESILQKVYFGLAQRPAVCLSLEKHIIAIKIEGITEATTTLAKYDSTDNFVDLDINIGEGIIATKTNKVENTRGEWLLQTEIDKIGGKRIDITYSYRITNIGDLDYIGKAMKDSLEDGKTYTQMAQSVKYETSKPSSDYILGTYLGTAYYTGNKTTEVETTVTFQIEDYMSTTKGVKLDTTSDFKLINSSTSKNIWDYVSTPGNVKGATNTATENVGVVQSKETFTLYGSQKADNILLRIYDESIDSTNTSKDVSYRSYAAQLVYPESGRITSESGTLCDLNSRFNNLKTVQSYVNDLEAVPVRYITPETDEFIAETVTITLDTGADKETPIILIISITAGLAIVAVGIVIIKKFVTK